MQPSNIKNQYFEKYLLSTVLNLTAYFRNVISFFLSKKYGEVSIFITRQIGNSWTKSAFIFQIYVGV